ncbi:MAG TPA: GTP cyclohydrolase II [Phenylobacterium sp.]|nr:GTP cyclohydrolase II [Phenylobacterium sp.]
MQPIQWGARTARARGPIVARGAARNAIGVHAGSYAVYRALATANGSLHPAHRPDLAGTDPVVRIGPFPQWSEPGRIVALDPWGHRVASDFADEIAAGADLRPTIAVAEGRLRMGEICEAMDLGRLKADGKVLSRAGEVQVTKIAIEPVWWLPGVAARLGLAEADLREALVSSTGGMYPDLIDRPDLKVFLPPVGGTSVYLFGDPARLCDPEVQVACRIHDECSGSDVFGSDLCTCRPYLAFGVEECVRMAQAGGLGVVAYNRKEGRALGEVVKLLVYNARHRAEAGDRPDAYFDRTEKVAGVQDMRVQDLATDVLHWLGVRRIDRWISMSNLKRAAVEAGGVEIVRQVAIPEALIPARADVEIQAKVASGYFSETL